MLAARDERQQTRHPQVQRHQKAQTAIGRFCQREQISMEELRLGSRRSILATRYQLAVHLVTQFGLYRADAARYLGVST